MKIVQHMTRRRRAAAEPAVREGVPGALVLVRAARLRHAGQRGPLARARRLARALRAQAPARPRARARPRATCARLAAGRRFRGLHWRRRVRFRRVRA